MVYNATIKKFFEYSLRCARGSGFINNVYFSSNPLKLYLARSNLVMIIYAVQHVKNKIDALDFGLGFGILLPEPSEIFGRIVGLDVDENKLTSEAKIIRYHSIHNVNLVCRSLDVEFDDFYDESFDSIVADNVLEHISYHYQILQNFYRIPRTDGLLIITLPSKNAIYRMFESKNDGHILRSIKDIHSLLVKIGKDFIEVGSFDAAPNFLTHNFSKPVEA